MSLASVGHSRPVYPHRVPQPNPLPSQPHAHDIVFQQMVLRTAQALPIPPPHNMPSVQLTVNVSVPVRKGHVATRPAVKRDETDDEGYYADRDNARTPTSDPSFTPKKPLVRVTSDVILELSPSIMSSQPPSIARCHICQNETKPFTYRLRMVDAPPYSASIPRLPAIFHISCFETCFDLEQPGAFSRIYPAPSSSLARNSASQPYLDDAAKDLVNAWKLQRRREGLETAAGPDSGIRIPLDNSSGHVRSSATRKLGDKRASAEAELEEERKRAKYYTSDDGYARATEVLLRKGITIGNRRPVMSARSQRVAGAPHLDDLPLKLSDALKRLDSATSKPREC